VGKKAPDDNDRLKAGTLKQDPEADTVSMTPPGRNGKRPVLELLGESDVFGRDRTPPRSAAPPVEIASAADLLARDFPPVRWVVPDLLSEGLCLLCGSPKIGKSWLALGLCIATATGGVALGKFRVEQGDALYLALEDNLRRLQSRLRKVLCAEPRPVNVERLDYSTACPRVSDGGLLVVEDWLKAHSAARLVVVDTLAKIRPPRRPNGNLYDEDYAAVQGLKDLADRYQVALVVVHHLRKASADDPIDQVSGSHGLTGGVDGVLVLKRERGRADAVLHVTGRDIEREQELALQWDARTAAWSAVGDAKEYRLTEEQGAVRRTIATAGRALTLREIRDALVEEGHDLTQNAVRLRLLRMVEGNVLRRTGKVYALPRNEEHHEQQEHTVRCEHSEQIEQGELEKDVHRVHRSPATVNSEMDESGLPIHRPLESKAKRDVFGMFGALARRPDGEVGSGVGSAYLDDPSARATPDGSRESKARSLDGAPETDPETVQ